MSLTSQPAPAVILVEDDAAVLNSLTFELELEGYPVRAYPSAESVLADEALPAAGCIVVDLNLPRVDGLALIDLLRGRGIRLPAILITSDPSPLTRERASGGGVAVVEKPLLGPALGEAIRRAIGASG